MKVGYTEFSYGYAFTENLIRSSSKAPAGAPVFPNLFQEGQSGFDVRINFPGVPLFFQYKLPELMRRGTAFEIAKWNCRGLTLPFFRISMMRSDVSRQHELLMKLEARYPSCVFYAAACLRNIGEFDRAYNSAAIAQQSAFFSPTEIGALPDNRVHTIAYQLGLAPAYFCSEPKEIKAQTYEGLAELLGSHFHQARFDEIEDSAREVRESVLELASPPMRQTQAAIEERIRASRVRIRIAIDRSAKEEQVITNILVAREIARVDLGVDVVVAQPRS
jgi:hypothetical protein